MSKKTGKLHASCYIPVPFRCYIHRNILEKNKCIIVTILTLNILAVMASAKSPLAHGDSALNKVLNCEKSSLYAS